MQWCSQRKLLIPLFRLFLSLKNKHTYIKPLFDMLIWVTYLGVSNSNHYLLQMCIGYLWVLISFTPSILSHVIPNMIDSVIILAITDAEPGYDKNL